MRTSFQHGKTSARIADLREKSLQVYGFRRGVRGGIIFQWRMVSNCAKEPSLRARSFDDRIDRRCVCGLAVRASDGDKLQRVGRMPKKVCRRNCQRLARL